jgi:hypothetical protein
MRLTKSVTVTALGTAVVGASLVASAAFANTPTIAHPKAAVGAKYNETPAPVVSANSPSAVLLAKEAIDAKVLLDQGGRRVFTKLVPWSEFVSTYSSGTADPQIQGSRKVWAVQLHYPDGYQTKRGLMSNAVVTTAYDAETGQVLGVVHRSLPAGASPGQ